MVVAPDLRVILAVLRDGVKHDVSRTRFQITSGEQLAMATPVLRAAGEPAELHGTAGASAKAGAAGQSVGPVAGGGTCGVSGRLKAE